MAHPWFTSKIGASARLALRELVEESDEPHETLHVSPNVAVQLWPR